MEKEIVDYMGRKEKTIHLPKTWWDKFVHDRKKTCKIITFKSIDDLMKNEHESIKKVWLGEYRLFHLEIKSKEENTSNDVNTTYRFLLNDSKKDVFMEASKYAAVLVNAFGSSKGLHPNFDAKTWSQLSIAKKGDLVNVAFLGEYEPYFITNIYLQRK